MPEQFSGLQSEIAAFMRYFTQAGQEGAGREDMLLNIATEELSNWTLPVRSSPC